MKKLVVSADDLCRIIKECAKSGVSEARLGELHLVFGVKDKSANTLELVKTKPLEQESIKISQEAQEQDIAAVAADYLEHLRLTDPLGYERMLGGELGDGQTP